MILTGNYLEVLHGTYDVMITDPPYSARTHDGQSNRRGAIEYSCWTETQYWDLLEWAHDHVTGWWVIITDNQSWYAVDKFLREANEGRKWQRYSFAPVPVVTPGLTVRFSGDGPACWAVYAHVSRPMRREWSRWRALPGAYVTSRQDPQATVADPPEIKGQKSLSIMREIVRDYSDQGMVVVDPCVGLGTTLLAAKLGGRVGVGAEIDPARADLARKRLSQPYTGTLL